MSWQCTRRGDCCRQAGALVMTLAERSAIEGVTREPLAWRAVGEGMVALLPAGTACPLYREGCTVYAVRPLNCRRYMCGRDDGDPYQPGVVPMKVLASKRLRRVYAENQARAMAEWGHAHGWSDSAI